MATPLLRAAVEPSEETLTGVRVWGIDFLDIIKKMQDFSCEVRIIDNTHSYESLADFVEHAPKHIRDLKIFARSKGEYRADSVFIDVSIEATPNKLRIRRNGSASSGIRLFNEIVALIQRRRKRFSSLLNTVSFRLVTILPVMALFYVSVRHSTRPEFVNVSEQDWTIFLCVSIACVVTVIYELLRGYSNRNDYHVRARVGDGTWWGTYGDKVVPVALSAVFSLFVGYLLAHLTKTCK